MDLIQEHNQRFQFFREITGLAMEVHREYKPGLVESAYEAALKYLMEQGGYKVERQVALPIYWKDIRLDETYRMDLVANNSIILELKAVKNVCTDHRRQLFNYMNITHVPYGMIINFGASSLYSEWYMRYSTGEIERVRIF